MLRYIDALFVVYPVVLFSLLQRINCYGPPRTFGQYKLILKEVVECSDAKINSIKVNESNNVVPVINYTNKHDNTVQYGYRITLNSDFNDDVAGAYTVYMLRQDGNWSMLYSLGVPRACSDTAMVVPELLDILTTVSPADTCSVPKGSYCISKYDLEDLKLSRFPDLPYNKYKIDLELFQKKTTVGCVTFVVNVSPRENEVL